MAQTMTIQEKNKLLKFLSHHFPEREEYPGYIVLGKDYSFYRDGQYVKNLKNISFVRTNHVSHDFNQFVFHTNSEYYISPNTFGSFCRRENCIRSFDNIVIDIDGHWIVREEFPSALNSLLYFLQEDFISRFDIPTPSVIFTGRGVQLWFAIESIAPSWKNAYISCAQFLADEIQGIISAVPSLKEVSVDYSASVKANGFFRLPFTYNKKAKQKGTILSISDERVNLPSFYQKIKKNSFKQKRKQRKTISSSFLSYRLQALERLADYRIKENTYLGCRDLLCFFYFSTFASIASVDEALQSTIFFNQKFPIPLHEKELKTYLKTAYNKAVTDEHYQFKTSTICNKLQTTDKETLFFKRKKKVSDDEILFIKELCEKGLNCSAIAQKTGRSVSTISRILHNSNLKTNKQKQTKQLKKDILRGISFKEAKEKYQISKSYFYELKKKINKEKEDDTLKKETIDDVISGLVEKGCHTEKELIKLTGFHFMTVRASIKRLYPEKWKQYSSLLSDIEHDLLNKILPIEDIQKKYHLSFKQIKKIKERLCRRITSQASRKVKALNSV